MSKRNGPSFPYWIVIVIVVVVIVGGGSLGTAGLRHLGDLSIGSSDDEAKEPGQAEVPAPSGEHPDENPLYAESTLDAASARSALAALPTEKAHSMAGYSKDEQFPTWRAVSSTLWADRDTPDASGCDARDATLVRDSVDAEVDPDDCSVTGSWTDPYGLTDEGDIIVTTESSDVQIDHIVPTAAAYRAGADEWTQERRTTYANDPRVLVASNGAVNASKGDKGPEVWSPHREDALCPYALRWIDVKATYELAILSEDERGTLESMLDTCPDA